ncbi:hypothetical protein KIPE111705_04405 [Kibdelosporangium persicum]|uniref:Uncharacterized protein n=1 Tax=Kibdelosporangium persicum TaxID=2698649 RepID=A0ABX2F6A2_9PSEU|nr:hypothetical protein [Kibdelosporangium persicum]
MDVRSSHEELRNELQGVARDEGLTPAKLESTRLLALMARLPEWSVTDSTRMLYKLIVDVVADLRGEKARTAARVTLNLDGSPVRGRSAMARQAALAEKRAVHADTVRAWWRSAVNALADILPLKIGELNDSPEQWNTYRNGSPVADHGTVPDHSFDRIEVAWRLRGKLATEMTTSRWLVSHRDGFDRVNARGWYFSDRSADSCEVVPLLNCRKVDSRHMGRGILVSKLELPQPLKQGESVFFAYKVVIHSTKETETLFYHNVASAGVKLLLYRVQFDPGTSPDDIWSFAGGDEVEFMTPPPRGSSRYLAVNRLGYAEQVFTDCRFGLKYGVSWRWPERGSMGEE